MGLKERNKARRLCPNCGESRIYPRTKTMDWRCSYCEKIFDFPIPNKLNTKIR